MHRLLLSLAIVVALNVFVEIGVAAEPLHKRIDQLIAAADPKFETYAAPVCDDATFLRRAFLDLAGVIPSAEQLQEFLDDPAPSPNKRAQWIDRLLTSPRHARHLQYVFDLMLMERRKGNTVAQKEWAEFLRLAVKENRPWNQVVQQILAADGADPKQRGAAKFYLDRGFDLDVVTRDVGRIFLGVDLECAQCHDHPAIDDYYQRHYYGIAAFLKRSYLFTDPKTKRKLLGEKAEGEVSFTSVFTQESGKTAPRLLEMAAIADPKATAKKYKVKPSRKARGVPEYSRRLQLAQAMVEDKNADFRRNLVNRLWALMMGRGLVEPLDIRHAANPPSHPKLLELLADDFLAHRYDIRWLLREMALSQTYQRASRVTDRKLASKAVKCYAVGLLKPLTPEQLAWSVMEATGVTTATLRAQQAALLKKKADHCPGQADDPWWQETALHAALEKNVAQFVTRFAGQGGQKTAFDTTAEQALFLINGPLVQKWLTPATTNLTGRLQAESDDRTVVRELIRTILSREPTAEESQELAEYLQGSKQRAAALQELAWALLSSAEFRFNH